MDRDLDRLDDGKDGQTTEFKVSANLGDFFNELVVDEVDESVAEESEDVAGEKFDSGLAANLVHFHLSSIS
jgi:hypothetical protein